MNNNFVILGLHLLLVGAGWLFVVRLRPAAARARAERDALEIRDTLVDAMLSGDIDRDNPRARDAIKFCDSLASNASSVKLLPAVGALRALRGAGVDIELMGITEDGR